MLKGDRIRKRLDAIGKSQADLAREISVSPQAISKMVVGETAESPKLYQIARYLGTTPEYLTGETDDPELPPQNTRATAKTEWPDEVEIAEIDLKYGMGGTYVDVPVEVEMRRFSRSWLKHFSDAAPEELFWARGQGNSMEPTIGDGEVVLIDRGQNRIGFGDNIYAFAYGEVGMMKRLRPLPDGTIEIHSDNPNINLPPAKAVDDELHIVGRVVAVVKRI